MKIWLTGAASFLGQSLAVQLRQAEADLFLTDLIPGRSRGIVELDVCEHDLARHLPSELDVVIHLAAVSSHPACAEDPPRALAVNVAGTLNVLRAAQTRGVKQLIFASSEWVYEQNTGPTPLTEACVIDPLALRSEYALSKWMAEAALRQAFLRDSTHTTILRFGILYGPRLGPGSAVESILDQVYANGAVRVGARATSRGFVHVEDAARAIGKSLGRTGFEIFNIQPDRPVTLEEVAGAAGRVLNRSAEIIETDPDHPSVRAISGQRARVALEWCPQMSIEQGIRDVARFRGYLQPLPGSRVKPREVST